MSEPFELPTELNIYSALETRDALLAWVTEQMSKSMVTANVVFRHSSPSVDNGR